MATFEQTYALPRGAGLRVEQQAGAVKVTGWENSEVKLVATSTDVENLGERIEVHEGNHDLVVQVKERSWFGFFRQDTQIHLEIRVPYGVAVNVDSGAGPVDVTSTWAPVRVDTGSGKVSVYQVGASNLDTGSGAVTAREVDGQLDIDTGSGAVECEDIRSHLSIDTGSGAVSVRQVKGSVEVDTGSGRVYAADVQGDMDVDTGSGHVLLERVHARHVRVDTGNGTVRLVGLNTTELEVDTSSGRVEVEMLQIHPGGQYKLDTGSGGVNVWLPPNAGVDISVSSSGRITYEGLNPHVNRREDDELEATLNGGGARLVIDSGSGSVQLRPLGVGHAAPGMPAAPAPPSPAQMKLAQALKDDPALESTDQMRRVLAMVEAGKLTAEEAEEILAALDEEDETA